MRFKRWSSNGSLQPPSGQDNKSIGFMAESDFEDRTVVGFADFNPMWPFSIMDVSSNYENITFGMEASHIKKNPPNPKDALISQNPIVVFKAATVLQSLGIIASRVLLQSSDVAGEKKDRTYCPTTWNYAYQYDTPATYSDQLREKGAASLLSHACVLAVIAQMSNKSQRHPQCAVAHAPSCVLSGMMVQCTSRRFQGPSSSPSPSSLTPSTTCAHC